MQTVADLHHDLDEARRRIAMLEAAIAPFAAAAVAIDTRISGLDSLPLPDGVELRILGTGAGITLGDLRAARTAG